MDLGTPFAIGNTAEIYLLENKIIKIFKDHLPNTESSNEANKQRFAYSCGLFVPRILDVTEVDGKQAIVMEYIEGDTIGDLLVNNMEKLEYYISISVDIQQKIHSVVTNSLEPMAKKLQRQIESVPILDERHKSILIHKLNLMTYEQRLCHGDFHLFNLIMSDKMVAIIDWVDSSSGDIRADVYRTYLLYYQYSMDLADMYLRLYCEKSGLLQEEVFQWAPIIAGARLSENVSSENAVRLLNIIHHYCPQ
ncbi:phosphotransferase family protein [Oceanobacillus chungangensis]|uniref:Aminoglycoside phosphotransferase n=1 Tax=Oceanobacillus chungangensis TaxID=1229152 RepID=A0A3D8Q1U3_9BACI|nr:aminoglycoside phosphotransferase family protein [Oceanobacillus chungangensis]RDW20975.1 aminoglycoside phosphotransferase [Oceanobacillus chungangensis]